MSGIFAVFTPDCVSFCEVSSHAANSKGRRLRFLGSHRRIVMSFYLILFAQTVFAISLTSLSLFHCCSPVSLLPISQEAKPHCGLRQRRSAFLLRGCGQSRCPYAENGLILSSEVVSTNGQGHGALVGFLVQHQVNVVLCGGIGAGAQAALTQAGIQLFGGISGSADAAAADYLAGRLVFDPQRPLQSSCPRSRARLRLPFLPRGQRRLYRELPLTKRVKKCRVPREKSRCSTHLYLHF